MKNILAYIFVMLILVGCSVNSKQQQFDNTASIPSVPTEGQEQSSTIQQTQIPQTTDAEQSTADKEWFVGSIGNAKIHAKLDISGKEVSGIYYYDQYKTNVQLHGSIKDNLKDLQVISLTEDTGKKGTIEGFIRTKDYIQGLWKSGNDIYPMYLIREGSSIGSPKMPSKDTMKFDGHWVGKLSDYFVGSEVDIKVLFDDLMFYELGAHSGTNNGDLRGFAIINERKVKTVFKDTTYVDKQENVFFEFALVNNSLNINSNAYDFACGVGVSFDSSYTKGKVDISLPTAQQVGIVDSKAQDELFKKIVGSEYEAFIQFTQGVNFDNIVLDGEKVKAGASYLRGLSSYCFYIVSPEKFYVAIEDFGIKYYTNDWNYSKKLPQPILDWAKDKQSLEVEYFYKE